MPDDHSDVVPLLPIPNRTVKRVSADDSADPRVKVGHCQAITAAKSPTRRSRAFCLCRSDKAKRVILGNIDCCIHKSKFGLVSIMSIRNPQESSMYLLC